jgi:hypothetical protein
LRDRPHAAYGEPTACDRYRAKAYRVEPAP